MRKRSLAVLTGVLLLCGSIFWFKENVSQTHNTDLSSVESGQVNLRNEVTKIRDFLLSSKFNTETCTPFLSENYNKTFSLSPEIFNLDLLREEALEVVQLIFEARLAGREKLAQFVEAGDVPNECISAVREMIRGSRVLEDILAEWALGYPQVVDGERTPAFDGGSPWLMVNPKFGELKLQSGDVLLSRGGAFVSAAIARITDVDTSFSHLAIFYEDEKTKEKYVVEAHIEIGSIAQEFEKYRTDGKARAVVFRHPDAKFAHQAAKAAYDRIRKHQKKTGENVPYDFGMDMSDANELFCSEVVSVGYQDASSDEFLMPLFKSSITMKNWDFPKRLGLKTKTPFSPADIEIDTRFELVAEWREFALLNESHMKDAILTSMYKWMDEHNYVLVEPSKVIRQKHIAKVLRKSDILSSIFKLDEKFPKNMKKSTIGAVSTLELTAAALYEHLAKTNQTRFQDTGFWLTPKEMLETLEQYRHDDLSAYRTYVKKHNRSTIGKIFRPSGAEEPDFHLLFRPKK